MGKVKESRINRLSFYDKVRLGTLIDGEGCISIARLSKPNQYTYRPVISIGGTYKAGIYEILDIVGTGRIYEYKPKNLKCKIAYNYCLFRMKDIEDVLLQLGSFVKWKQLQSQIMLEYLNSRLTRSGPSKYTLGFSPRELELYNILHDLNAKGPDAVERQDELRAEYSMNDEIVTTSDLICAKKNSSLRSFMPQMMI